VQAMPKKTITNNGVIAEKYLHPSMNNYSSRFELPPKSSLVRIPPSTIDNERERLRRKSGGPGAIWTLDPRHVKAVS